MEKLQWSHAMQFKALCKLCVCQSTGGCSSCQPAWDALISLSYYSTSIVSSPEILLMVLPPVVNGFHSQCIPLVGGVLPGRQAGTLAAGGSGLYLFSSFGLAAGQFWVVLQSPAFSCPCNVCSGTICWPSILKHLSPLHKPPSLVLSVVGSSCSRTWVCSSACHRRLFSPYVSVLMICCWPLLFSVWQKESVPLVFP